MMFLYQCDMLVDQEIGSDGYKCGNPAVSELSSGALICAVCARMDSARLSLPLHYGKKHQEEVIKQVWDELQKRIPSGPPIG